MDKVLLALSFAQITKSRGAGDNDIEHNAAKSEHSVRDFDKRKISQSEISLM